jgi:Cu2+-containing amine oxidase
MMITILLSNWKLVLVGVLLMAIAALSAAYAWQRVSLQEARDDKEWAEHLTELQKAKADALAQNLADVKAHQARVQVVEKEVIKIREVIREVPVVTFAGNCEQTEEARNNEAENIQRIARGIADYFNTGVLPADFHAGDRGEVLPASGAPGPGGSKKSERAP